MQLSGRCMRKLRFWPCITNPYLDWMALNLAQKDFEQMLSIHELHLRSFSQKLVKYVRGPTINIKAIVFSVYLNPIRY